MVLPELARVFGVDGPSAHEPLGLVVRKGFGARGLEVLHLELAHGAEGEARALVAHGVEVDGDFVGARLLDAAEGLAAGAGERSEAGGSWAIPGEEGDANEHHPWVFDVLVSVARSRDAHVAVHHLRFSSSSSSSSHEGDVAEGDVEVVEGRDERGFCVEVHGQARDGSALSSGGERDGAAARQNFCGVERCLLQHDKVVGIDGDCGGGRCSSGGDVVYCEIDVGAVRGSGVDAERLERDDGVLRARVAANLGALLQ
mmetsp:Transcript_930/g.3522  ORF Transcript_930/g.3522 Transcript_930/m.3522 type:complete len:257 (+) Transcript_930:291-1061(+)